MITMERIFKEGFLDGMRYSGRLVSDVPDEHLNLTKECQIEILKSYRNRTYEETGLSSSESRWMFIKTLITDQEKIVQENIELRKLLETANEDKARLMSGQ